MWLTMARRKRKIKKYYTISVTSDYSGKKSRVYRCRFNFIQVILVCALLILCMAVGLTYYWYTNLSGMEDKVTAFKELIAKQEQTIISLGNEKNELESSNVILGDMLSKAENELLARDEAESEERIPSLFPIDGAVLVSNLEKVTKPYIEGLGEITEDVLSQTMQMIAEEYSSVLVFEANQSCDMVAAGAGIVRSVGEDDLFGAYVIVDHGNGYESVYRNNGDLKVDAGDKVFKGQLIFVNCDEEAFLGVQIVLDGNYVDPLSVINTNG